MGGPIDWKRSCRWPSPTRLVLIWPASVNLPTTCCCSRPSNNVFRLSTSKLRRYWCARNANNKPRPLRLKLVPDAAGLFKASFHCFVKFDFPPVAPLIPPVAPTDFNGWRIGAHPWRRCIGVSTDGGGEYLVEWTDEEPSWVTKEQWIQWSDRKVNFSIQGLGLEGLEGVEVEVFWNSNKAHPGKIVNCNRDGTFKITYGDGDCDKRLDLLRLDERLYKSDWGYEHVVCEWSCILD